MRIISRTELAEDIRAPHLKAYRDQLRQRLLYAATDGERQYLLRLLDKADDSKPAYTADSPPPLGAIDFSTLPPQIFVKA